jgi:DNA-directed RNA polymerase specialized sigma24 family protein
MTSVAALRPRPDRSFERLYRRHAEDLYRFALALIRDPHEAEAITQDAFASAYRALRRGDRPARAHRWLVELVLDTCREREAFAMLAADEVGDDRPGGGPLVCQGAELAVSRALDGLLARREREALGVHLAWCGDCAGFAQRQHAQRSALQALTRVPLPPALATWTAADSAAVAGPM